MQHARDILDSDGVVGEVAPVDSLAARAYGMLRDAIVSNQIEPGERLSVSGLARRMHISRTPVREAVQRLIYEGLAVHVPHRGAEVVRVGAVDIRQLFEVREVLDGLAARLACQQMAQVDVAGLAEILEQHEALLESGGEAKSHIDLDIAFHGRIRELAGNPHLVEMLGRIQGKSHVAMHFLWRGADAPRLALEEHHRILEALSGGDPDDAERTARAHVVRLQERLPQALATASSDGAAATRGADPSPPPVAWEATRSVGEGPL